MNDFRKIAKFVQDNHLTVQAFKVEGKGGGFDDYNGYYFFKGNYKLEGVSLTVSAYELDEEKEASRVLSLLEEELRNLNHVDVIGMESLEKFLKKRVVG